MSTTPDPRPVAGIILQLSNILSREPVIKRKRLASSVEDPPLVSVAGISKPNHSSPPAHKLIPLSEVLPMMEIALCCVWAANTTTKLPEVAASTEMSPEVAADAAEPLGVVTLAAGFSEARATAAVSPEVAAHVAEPPVAAGLSSAPCMVVASSNILSACRVAVEETVTAVETPEVAATAVEPPEVAATAAEPPEVSVVSTHQLSSCPVYGGRLRILVLPYHGYGGRL